MPKAPKALTDILKNAKPSEPPPPEFVPIPGRPVALEVGTNASSILLSASNSGPDKQISLASPFGRPPLEPGQKPPEPITPILEPESEEEISAAEAEWDKLRDAELENEMEEITPKDIDFVPPQIGEGAFLKQPDSDLVHEIEDNQEEEEAEEQEVLARSPEPTAKELQLLEELAELRKANRDLRERYNVASNKDGVEMALATVSVERTEKECALIKLEDACRQIKKLKSQPSAKLPDWLGRDVRVAFPCYKTTNPATAMALVALALDFGKERIGFLPGLGDARIANSRNRLAAQFLETGAKWCLWLDDDMIPTVGRPQFTRDFIGATPEEVPDKVLGVHVLDRLMAAGKHLVGATYFGRRKYSPAMFKEGIDNPIAYEKAKKLTGEVIPCEWVATGCMLVHRDVFIGIQNRHPELAPNDKRKNWDFFQEGEGETGGEDVMFCRRAKAAGYQPYVDTGCLCLHVGAQVFGNWNTTNPLIRPIGATPMETNWWK